MKDQQSGFVMQRRAHSWMLRQGTSEPRSCWSAAMLRQPSGESLTSLKKASMMSEPTFSRRKMVTSTCCPRPLGGMVVSMAGAGLPLWGL